MDAKDHKLELGSNSFVGTFEEQLSAQAGDHRTVTVTFPDNYAAAELQAKEAVFEVDVKEIRSRHRPSSTTSSPRSSARKTLPACAR